jgi:hypothetical protein
MRVPAVPLLTTDPYFSIWMAADTLTAKHTSHWTGKTQKLEGLIRFDGEVYRFLGKGDEPCLEQKKLAVYPTRTVGAFAGPGFELEITFFTPQLPGDLELMGTPLSYVFCKIAATDGQKHDLELFFAVTAEAVVNETSEEVVWSRFNLEGETVLKMGTDKQPVLEKAGDDLRINWGYLYLTAPKGAATCLGTREKLLESFTASGALPAADSLAMPAPVWPQEPCLGACFSYAQQSAADCRLTLIYDQRQAISYFQRPLVSYWQRGGQTIGDLIVFAAENARTLLERGKQFDSKLLAEAKAAGGEDYAQLTALSYRQCLAAHKLVVDINGEPLYFSKENFSNGCIATVDVTYPSAPLFLLLEPRLLRAMLSPVFAYAESHLWPHPFAPHDLGTYPKANGQVYSEQMPVEESGNMILLAAALAVAEGNFSFAQKHWPTISSWADYLLEYGFDPENQLCTDDFAGHLARNANLSLKSIMALGAYGKLCARLDQPERGNKFYSEAQKMASRWESLADAGDHYSLAFEAPATWSLKYNLIWDELLGLDLFGARVAQKEVAFYLTKQNAYGTPLDSREDYTKSDWLLWAATLATNSADFQALIAPLLSFLRETPSRVPFTDWYDTKTGKQVGFQARSVVGGIFLKMLLESWRKENRKL